MKADELRARFLDFFEKHGHCKVSSSGLIPANDPTLLFANAGMNQFKDVFLNREKRDYKTACSSQKCVRAGGKHNDLDNVGYTARHHTFFEMLGNFSFGDYFKEKAIALAWSFLTEELKVPTSRLYVTVYEEDDQAYEIWRDQVGVPENRIFRFGKKDNFWSMGDTGPCGPCSEIFYDYGTVVEGSDDPYEGIASGSDRYVEVWNLVFMQFDAREDGHLTPLANPSIDTGMGLERMSSVLQGVHNNYDTDLFQDIIQPVAKELGVSYGSNHETDTALRVIADHLRAMSFLIADGVVPSNEGRGYVLRRIMRRAMRFGKQLGRKKPFLHQMTRFVVEKMGDHFAELTKEQKQIELLVRVEEEQFDTTLEKGMPILTKYLNQLKKDGLQEVPGQVIFFMYGTHGFPVDLMQDIARDWDMTLNLSEYEELLAEDAKTAGEKADFSGKAVNPVLEQLAGTLSSEMLCHAGLVAEGAIRLILRDENAVDRIEAGQEAQIVLDRTPFYAESGGQIGDQGEIETADGVFQVTHTTKVLDKLVVHHGQVLSGSIKKGGTVTASVSAMHRRDVRKNHTATHLLHQALRDVLGLHVRQAGSLVDAEKLRFDFSHFAALSPKAIIEIENIVNQKILDNLPVETEEMDLAAAKAKGAMALFGEKYDNDVRVVSVGDYSMELCGGTHCSGSGEIGVFKIVSERGLAAGIRRLVALTGSGALKRFQESEILLAKAQDQFHLKRENMLDQLKKSLDERKALEKTVEELKIKLAKGGGATEQVEELDGFKVLVKKVDSIEGGQLRNLADELMNRIGSGVVLLGSDLGEKVQLIAKAKDVPGIHAGNLVKSMAPIVGGSGGGRPDMAMAGGKDASRLEEALKQGLESLRQHAS